MLTLARKSRGLTQTELARQVGVSQGKLCKYELNLLAVSPDDLAALAKALDYPEEFFRQTDDLHGLGGCFYYRKRLGLPVKEREAIEAQLDVIRLRVNRLLRGIDLESPNHFPWFDLDNCDGSPEEAARRTRAAWRLPDGPIRNVTSLIEGAGGIVVRRLLGTTQIDAIIQCPDRMRPIFLVNASVTAGDRIRFTLSHEIGHIIMRNWMSPDPDNEADRFASEFLMPSASIAPDLDCLTIDRAMRLKPYWKVSIQSIIRKASYLGKISPRKYRSLMTEIGARQYRLHEPIPIPVEQPKLIFEIVETYKNHYEFTDADILALIHSGERDYASQFKPDKPGRMGWGIVG